MEEILRLQRELAEVQQTSAQLKLSEPNVVEIVSKLIQAGKLKLIFTQNGKEYLTHEQLLSELEDEVLAHGGRANLSELQPTLNVDLTYIEQAARQLLEKDPSAQLLQGEILTEWYLDGVAEQINSLLQQSGRLAVSELAMDFRFSMDFMSALVAKHLDRGTIVAQLAAGTLYTPAYVLRHAAQMRGALTALVQPTPLAELQETHKLNASLVQSTLAELVDGAHVAGALQAAGFVPSVFECVQAASVDAFFAANGWVEYRMVSRLQIPNPRRYLAQRHPGGVELESCYVSAAMVERIEGLVDECAAAGTMVEVGGVVPASFSAEDAAAVLAKCRGALAKGEVKLVGDGAWLVSAGLLDTCAKSIVEREEARSRDAAASGGVLPTAVVSTLDADEDEAVIISTSLPHPPKRGGGEEAGGARSKRGGKGKKGKRRGDDDDDDDDDDAAIEAMLPSTGGKAARKGAAKRGGGGGGGGGGGSKARAADGADEGDEAAAAGGARGRREEKGAEETTALAAHLHAALGLDEEQAEVLASELVGRVFEARAQLARQAQLASATSSKKRQQALQEAVQADGGTLQLLARAVSALGADATLPLDDADVAALCKAVLAGKGAALAANVTESELLHQHMEVPSGLGTDGDGRKRALGRLRDGAAKAALTRLWTSASAKAPTSAAVDSFVSALGEACEACSLHWAPLDKKKEKALLAGVRAAARASLEQESEPLRVLLLALETLACELCSMLVPATRETAAALVKALGAKLPEPAAQALAAYAELVLGGQSATEEAAAAVKRIALTKEARSAA